MSWEISPHRPLALLAYRLHGRAPRAPPAPRVTGGSGRPGPAAGHQRARATRAGTGVAVRGVRTRTFAMRSIVRRWRWRSAYT